jgi:hypothetical protein
MFLHPGWAKKEGWSKKESHRVVQKRTVRPGGQKKTPKPGGQKCFENQPLESRRVAEILHGTLKFKEKAGFLAKNLEKCRNGAREKLESGLLRKG